MRHGCVRPRRRRRRADGPFPRLTRAADLFINVCLTLLGYLPGHVHAFYLEFVYYDRRERAHAGGPPPRRAPGVYSDRVQTGGRGYGTVAQPTG